MNQLLPISMSYRIWLLALVSVLALAGNLTLTTPVRAVISSQVSAGGYHTCALTTSGGVLCWGYNSAGQLGTGNNTDSNVPLPVSGLSSGVSAISAGGAHTCALTTNGGVLCWGAMTGSNVPVAVSGLSSGVRAISAGAAHTCAVTTSGGAFCWGANHNGQLGAGNNTDSTVPVAVSGLSSGVSAISAGGLHTCAVTTSGGAFCWGLDVFGELGTGYTHDSTVPMAVRGLESGVSAISAGYFHTCAVTTGGSALCWGENFSGQLGNGDIGLSTVPVPVSGLDSGIAHMALGRSHTCAATTSGSAFCWGRNVSGELGTGNNSNSNVPVAVSGLNSSINAIGAGDYHTCALTISGGVLCWGYNPSGQLGTGNNTDSNVPTSSEFNATITVVLDMQPDSNANIQFAGDLGNFQLDNPMVDDSDAYTTTRKFIVNPGTYILAEVVPTPYFASVTCVGSVTRAGQSALSLTLSAAQNVVCTFTNQRAGQITASKYNDRNHNHVRNSTDEWLNGWTMQLFTAPGTQVGVQTTNANGSASFPNLRPGPYTVCEVMQSGWFNITPNVLNRLYQKPCSSVTVNPGQAVTVRFGNSTTPLVAAADVGEFNDIIVMDLSDTDDDSNAVMPLPDPWPDTLAEQTNALFLPLVTR